MYIPDKKGYEIILDTFPLSKNLKYGYYHVEIKSSNKNAKKVFSFNNNNVYNCYDVLFALRNRHLYDFEIELVHDGEPNAYVYDSVVKTSKMFGRWYKTLVALKTKFPDNKLIKQLGSSLWGILSQTATMDVQRANLIKENYLANGYQLEKKIVYGDPNDELNYKEYYRLFQIDKPYQYNIRLKGFLNAYTRTQTAKLAELDIDNVIRIHTDCVSFKKPQTVDTTILKLEDKSSGLIQWNNVNNYTKIN